MRGQVWIETVIYTLIGISLIGLVLAFVTPKINEAKDKALVEQSIATLGALDEKINNVIESGSGNIRIVEVTLKKGILSINESKDEIWFVLNDLNKPYSEPNVVIDSFGDIKIKSIKGAKTSSTYIYTKYESVDIVYEGGDADDDKSFGASPSPYRISIEHKGVAGEEPNRKTIISLKEVS